MSNLPSLTAPTFPVKLFSQPQPVMVRPYTVREEKLFLMADGDDVAEATRAVKQVLRNCTFDKINVDTLPSFDLEYLLIKLRCHSVNPIATAHYECQSMLDTGARCGTVVPVQVNLNDITLTVDPTHTQNIKLSETAAIHMTYPTFAMLETIKADGLQFSVDLAAECTDMISVDGNVIETRDIPKEETVEFINGMTLEQWNRVQHFFNTMPTLIHVAQFLCPTCKHSESIVISGLLDFFD